MIRYFHIPAALLFLVMAAIQLNDPDPLYWVVVYTASAVVAAAKLFAKPASVFTHITVGMILAGLLISVSGTLDYVMAGDYGSITGKMTGEKPYIESAREFGGLFIVVIYLAIAHWPVISRQKRDPRP